jgi:hypothetical protein
MELQHLKNENISAFYVNVKGQLCIPNHDDPQQIAIFNIVIEQNGFIYFGFSPNNISPNKQW